jgi:hypothetical protein
MATSHLRIIVLGYIVRGPLGGLAWHYLQYVLGLSRLGHEVFFVEQGDDYPSCYDPARDTRGTDPTYGLQFIDETFRRVGLDGCWAFFDVQAGGWCGPQSARIQQICRDADLCLNVSGMNQLPPFLRAIPVRVFIDTDPAFTQIRHLTDDEARQRALHHNAFFTFAENLPEGRASIPDDGLPWLATRQPVVLDAWPVGPPDHNGRFTSVLLWESYQAREYAGRHYGLKAQSFGPFLDLPRRSGRVFELALGGPSAPAGLLEKFGWSVFNPLEATRDPWTYQGFIRRSKAEFGIAKHGYVVSRSGWFSERTAGYLASGRPAIVQDTGFSEWLPRGEGVLPFDTLEDVLAAIDSVDTHYERHCRAARDFAEAYFDARTVLARLIDRAMVAPASAASGEVAASRQAPA